MRMRVHVTVCVPDANALHGFCALVAAVFSYVMFCYGCYVGVLLCYALLWVVVFVMICLCCYGLFMLLRGYIVMLLCY